MLRCVLQLVSHCVRLMFAEQVVLLRALFSETQPLADVRNRCISQTETEYIFRPLKKTKNTMSFKILKAWWIII